MARPLQLCGTRGDLQRRIRRTRCVGCVSESVRNGAVVGEGWHGRPPDSRCGTPSHWVNALRSPAGDQAAARRSRLRHARTLRTGHGEGWPHPAPMRSIWSRPGCRGCDANPAASRIPCATALIGRWPGAVSREPGVDGGRSVENRHRHAQACGENDTEAAQGSSAVYTRGRPFVRLKLACSIDGCDRDGERREPVDYGSGSARGRAAFCARSGAILSGIGTVLADDPSFTVRDPEIDGRRSAAAARRARQRGLRMPLSAEMLALPGETWSFARRTGAGALREAGATVVNSAQITAGSELIPVLRGTRSARRQRPAGRGGAGVAGSLLEERPRRRACDLPGTPYYG